MAETKLGNPIPFFRIAVILTAVVLLFVVVPYGTKSFSNFRAKAQASEYSAILSGIRGSVALRRPD